MSRGAGWAALLVYGVVAAAPAWNATAAGLAPNAARLRQFAVEHVATRPFSLSLHEGQDGQCALRQHSANTADAPRTLPTQLPWPCAFHVDQRDAVRVLRRGRADFLLIESSHATSGRDCDTRLQALRISARADVALSAHRSRLAACPPFQWEEPLFTALF